MAGLILGTVGSVVGGMIGGPLGARAGWAAGSILGNAFGDSHDPIKQEGQRLNDLNPKLNTNGVIIPVVFGTVKTFGHVIWKSEIRETVTTTTTSQGGKGGGGQDVETTNYTYHVDLLVAFCKGPITALRKVWANSILIYDASATNTSALGSINQYMKFYNGSEEQEIDPTLQAALGDFANANRGIACCMFTNLPLTEKFANQIPQFEFEVINTDLGGGPIPGGIGGVTREYWTNVISSASKPTVYYKFAALKLNPVDNYIYGALRLENGPSFELVVIEPNTKKIIRKQVINVPTVYKSKFYGDVNIRRAEMGGSPNGMSFDRKGNIIFSNTKSCTTVNRQSLTYSFDCYTISDIAIKDSYRENNTPLPAQSVIDDMHRFGKFKLNDIDKNGTESPIFISSSGAAKQLVISNTNYVVPGFPYAPNYNLIALTDLFTTSREEKEAAGIEVAPSVIPAELSTYTSYKTIENMNSSVFKSTMKQLDADNFMHDGVLNTTIYSKSKDIVYFFTSKYNTATTPFNYCDFNWILNSISAGGILTQKIATIYDDPTLTKKIQTIIMTHYDDLKDKIYIQYKYDDSAKWFISKINSSNGVIEDTVELTAPAGSTFYFRGTPNERARKFYFICSRTGSKAFYEMYVDFETLDITYFEAVHDSNTEEKPMPINISPVYNASEDLYILEGPYDNSAIVDGEDMQDKAMLFAKIGTRIAPGDGGGGSGGWGYSLASVVRKLCLDAGIKDADLDVSDLASKTVRGLIYNTQNSARTVIDKLALIFNFDNCESNGKLKYKFKGKDSVRTISADNLSAKFYSADNEFLNDLNIVRNSQIELPKKINVIYVDVDKEYAQNTQEAKRNTNVAGNIISVEAPIVLSANEAKQVAERLLYSGQIERDIYKFETNYEIGADLEPSDVVTVNKNGTSHILRITKKDESQGICKFEAVAENRTSYIQNGTGDSGETGGQTILQDMIDDTIYVIMDSPIFNLNDKDFGAYVAACRSNAIPGSTWKGANIAIKNANDTSFQTVAQITKQSTIGYVQDCNFVSSALNVIDRVSKITIKLFNGELSGCTYEELLNGKNLCYIGGKYFQFMNAELIDTDIYELSFILQNRFCDLVSSNIVTSGMQFVLCDEQSRSGIVRVSRQNLILGSSEDWRIWSIGKLMNRNNTIPRKNNATSIKPRRVSNVKVNQKVGTGIYLNWNYSVLGNPFLINNYDVYADNDPVIFDVTVQEKSIGLKKTYASAFTFFNYLQEAYKNDLASIGIAEKNIDTANLEFTIEKKSQFAGNGPAVYISKNADILI